MTPISNLPSGGFFLRGVKERRLKKQGATKGERGIWCEERIYAP